MYGEWETQLAPKLTRIHPLVVVSTSGTIFCDILSTDSSSSDDSSQQDDLKKLEELHQKQKIAEEQIKKEHEKRKIEEVGRCTS